MPIVVTATVTPLPELREEVRKTLLDVLPAVHEEAGCNLYALHENETSFLFVEHWDGEAALEAHNSGETVRQLLDELDGKLGAPIEVVLSAPVSEGEKGSLTQALSR
jgi:quinol monooxygenase YgiN